jgi:HlyD family secretion protein
MTQSMPQTSGASAASHTGSQAGVVGQTKRRPNPRLLLLPVGLAIAGIVGWQYWTSRPVPGILRASGRMEGYETDIGAKTGGRVGTVVVREGDAVKKGQVLVEISDDEIQAQLRGAVAKVAASREQVQQAEAKITEITGKLKELDSRIEEAGLNLQQSRGDSQGRVDQATATVSATRAQLAQAEAQVKQAEAQVKQAISERKLAAATRDRYAQLVAQGAINQQQYDQAQTAWETAQANVDTQEATLNARQAAVIANRDQLEAAQGGLMQVETTGLNPAIRDAQLSGLYQQREQVSAQLASAQADLKRLQAEVNNAIANQSQVQAQLAYLTVTSPIAGVVTARSVEPGQVVASGKTLLSVLNLQQDVYLRGFVPQGESGKVRVGQPAKVFLDSAPKQGLEARVSAIDPEAAFTPENIYFQQDRVRQVVGIRVKLTNPGGYAKPGMPADVEIDVK